LTTGGAKISRPLAVLTDNDTPLLRGDEFGEDDGEEAGDDDDDEDDVGECREDERVVREVAPNGAKSDPVEATFTEGVANEVMEAVAKCVGGLKAEHSSSEDDGAGGGGVTVPNRSTVPPTSRITIWPVLINDRKKVKTTYRAIRSNE
jgi:hypothetical protein